jgi:hypothetical protein
MAGNLFNADPIPITSNPSHTFHSYPLFFQAGLSTIPPNIEIKRLTELRNLSFASLSINLGSIIIVKISFLK